MFGLTDRGRIAPGLRADLVLVHGDPTVDIHDTRHIQGVWIGGRPMDRAAWGDRLAQAIARTSTRSGPPLGLISDFAPGTPTSQWGGGWVAITDAIRGGASTATVAVLPDTGAPSGHALRVDTAVAPAVGWQVSYAGSSFRTTDDDDEEGVNLTRATAITITARADDTTTVLLVSLDAGYRLKSPVVYPIVLTHQYKQFTIPLSAFGELDLSRSRSLNLVVGKAGTAHFYVGAVQLVQ